MYVGRATRARTDQPRPDIAPDKRCSRDGSRDDGHDEEKDCRGDIERATGSDRIGLIEEVEDGDIGERRPVHARSADAVEQKHQEEQRAPGRGR